jgi:hypothetical protein
MLCRDDPGVRQKAKKLGLVERRKKMVNSTTPIRRCVKSFKVTERFDNLKPASHRLTSLSDRAGFEELGRRSLLDLGAMSGRPRS